MPDGERGTTGSEPTWEDLVTITMPRAKWAVIADAAESYDVRVPREQGDGGECLDVIRRAVEEPGHDEQTEGRGDEGMLAEDEAAAAYWDERRAVWQPDPRTVAAVVEALREEYEGSSCAVAAEYIENHPRFEPSAPGGTDGH
jgi:hypothetical protein